MFEEAVIHLLKNEGKYVNHIKDPGGATNYGVSLRYLKTMGLYGDFNKDGKVDHKDIKAMVDEDAKEIYKKFWWDKYRYGEIKNKRIASKLLDMSVNIGSYKSHKLVQHALNKTHRGILVEEDGVMGSKTIEALNHIDLDLFRPILIVCLSQFYIHLYEKDPLNRNVFIIGWLRRASKI